MPDDELFQLIESLDETIPNVLQQLGKIKNPWPNVDAYSGSLLYHYGIKEYTFYTVLFGVSRALGVLASLVNDRIYGMPIERPTSHPLSWFKEMAGESIEDC